MGLGGERIDECVAPGGDVVALDALVQSAPAADSLLEVHGQGALQRLGDFLGAVRIDDQGLAHLVGRAGELRQHQHAGIVGILGGDELLGDQVHPVAHGRDQAHLGGAVDPR